MCMCGIKKDNKQTHKEKWYGHKSRKILTRRNVAAKGRKNRQRKTNTFYKHGFVAHLVLTQCNGVPM